MNEKICPVFDRCFVSSIMESIEVPYLLQYCQQGYMNCRYYSSMLQQVYIEKEMEEVLVV